MIFKLRTVTLSSGETLVFWKSTEGPTTTVDVRFEKDGPTVASATSGSEVDALAALAERFHRLGVELNTLNTKPVSNPYTPQLEELLSVIDDQK